LHGAEKSTLWNADQKHLEHFEISAGEGWRRSVAPIVLEMKKWKLPSTTYNVLLKENKKGRETEKIDIRSYWMTLRK